MIRSILLQLFAFSVLAGSVSGQPPASAIPLTVLSREGRRPLPSTTVDGQEMVGLDDLAATFGVVVREDALAGGVTVSYKGKSIVLTPGQPLASVSGRLVSLAAPLTRSGQRWLVSIDFVSRALALIYDAPLDLRRTSRLLIVGDLRVPRIVARYEPAGSTARVTLDIVPRMSNTIVQEPRRLLVKFDADALDAPLAAQPPPALASLVSALHVIDPGNVLAMDLGPRFVSFRATTTPTDAASTRLIIDFLPPEAEATPSAPPPGPEPAPMPGAPASSLRTIVIDPGHGGDEQGAKGSAGALEKDIALSVGRRLKAAIEGRLGIRVLLTRDDDRTVGLDERAAIANNNKADLFLSLHANASVRKTAKGAEIFYLSLDKYGDDARRLAASEGQLLPVFGGGNREIEVILWDMAQARYIEQSAALASLIEEQLRGHVEMSGRAIQQAPFRVLVGANMPAVLVEMGYITHPGQEQQLASPAFQNTLVQALLDGVVRFRSYLDQGRIPAPSQMGHASAQPTPPGR